MRRTILLAGALALAAAGCGAPPPTGNGPVPVQNTNAAAPASKAKVPAWPGVYDAKTGTFSLRTGDTPDKVLSFTFGVPGMVPIAGDWDGDGVATVGVFDDKTGTFSLASANAASAPATTFM